MTGFGDKLRIAREQKGLTRSQLADITRILVQIIQGLEEEDFSRIVAPIYGRGFVKLYAEAVGLDPKECIDEFMFTLNNKDKPTPTSLCKEQLDEQDITNPPVQKDIFKASSRQATNVQLSSDKIGFESSRNPLSKYATPIPQRVSPFSSIKIPARIWRLTLLALGALIFIVLIGASVKALYKTTTPRRIVENPEKNDVAIKTKTTPSTDKASNARKVIDKTPELYFD